MRGVSIQTRLLHFAGSLLYLLFFLAFYTLPALNLHALDDKKSFFIAFFFPFILTVIIVVRLFMRNYPDNLVMLFISKGSNEDTSNDPGGRKVIWFISTVAFLLPVSLISFDLARAGFHSEAYSQMEFYVCIAAAITGSILGYIIIFRAEKHNKLLNKIILGTLLAAIFGAVGWWAVCEINVMYEMIAYHPEVFRI